MPPCLPYTLRYTRVYASLPTIHPEVYPGIRLPGVSLPSVNPGIRLPGTSLSLIPVSLLVEGASRRLGSREPSYSRFTVGQLFSLPGLSHLGEKEAQRALPSLPPVSLLAESYASL